MAIDETDSIVIGLKFGNGDLCHEICRSLECARPLPRGKHALLVTFLGYPERARHPPGARSARAGGPGTQGLPEGSVGSAKLQA
jgi:hypothetical protein